MFKTLYTLALAALGCLSAAAASAASVDLAASKDSTLYENPAAANGRGEHIFVGFTAQPTTDDERRSLIAFDFDPAAIPAGSVVTAVELRLQVSRANGGNPGIAVHRVLRAWSEGPSNPAGNEGGGGVAQPGDSTWSHAVNPGSPWTTAGGDYLGEASATTVVDEASPAWNGAGLVADVQRWLDHPEENFGWILISDLEEAGAVRRFFSAQSTVAAQRPMLHVEFTAVPVPPAALLLLSSGWLMLFRRRHGSANT